MQVIGRLLVLREGDACNAYYALTFTNYDAMLLGSVRMSIVEGKPERLAAFIAIMRAAIGDLVLEETGRRAVWPEA